MKNSNITARKQKLFSMSEGSFLMFSKFLSFQVFRFSDFQVIKFFKTFLVPSFCLTFRNFFQRFRHNGAPLTFCNLNIPLLLFYTRTPNPWSTKNAMPDPQIYSTSRVFLIVPVSSTSAEQSTYLLEKSDLTTESSVAGTGRDVRDELINKRQRRRRRRRRKVFFDQWALKIDEIWWRKSVSELWGHSERTVRKWRRNWRRRSPRQEQKEADIKNHLLHGTFVLFLLFLKLN